MGDPIAYHMHMREHRMIQNEWMDKLEKEAKNKAEDKSETAKAQQQPKKEVARKHDELEESWLSKWVAIGGSKVRFIPEVKNENASKPSKLTVVSNATVLKSMSSIEALIAIEVHDVGWNRMAHECHSKHFKRSSHCTIGRVFKRGLRGLI